jgi:uncharacterized protein YjbI with pentapeptide repeats
MVSVKTILKDKLALSPPIFINRALFGGCQGDKSLRDRLSTILAQDSVNSRFIPHLHGFKFDNNFTSVEYISNEIVFKSWGRCGGMVFAALDYFLSSDRSIPQSTEMPVPCSWLDTYIYERHVACFWVIVRYAVGLALDPNPTRITNLRNDCAPNRNTYDEVREMVADRPCVIILIPRYFMDHGEWHVVLAVGCTHSDVDGEAWIHIHDPNHPDKECVLIHSEYNMLEYELDCHGRLGPLIKDDWSAYIIGYHYNYQGPPADSYEQVDLSGQDCRNWQPDPARYNNYTGSILNRADFTNNNVLGGLDFGSSEAKDADFFNVTAAKSSFSFCTFHETDFSEADLKGSSFIDATDLHSSLFKHAQLQDADFSGFTGYDTDFSNAIMNNAKFKSATLHDARFETIEANTVNFNQATLLDSKWMHAKITAIPEEEGHKWTKFGAAKMDGADFTNCEINRALFYLSRLCDAIFVDASLSHINFEFANLSGADFSNARLTYCDFINTDSIETDFDGATMSNITFDSLRAPNKYKFKNTQLNTIDIKSSNMPGAEFDGATICSLTCVGSTMDGAKFISVRLSNCSFKNCSLNDIDFSGATLTNVDFHDITMDEFTSCDWTGVSCSGVRADDSEIQNLINGL